MELKNERQRRLYATSVFLLRLLLLGLVFRALILLVPSIRPLQKIFAAASAYILEIILPEVSRAGIDIKAGEWFRVTRDCTGWKSVAALTGITIASKSWKTGFILKGILLIMVANLFRIVTIIYLDFAGIASFSLVHGFIWRWGLTGIVLVIWIYQVRGTSVRENMM